MVQELLEQNEAVTFIPTLQTICQLPDWVLAQWPTEEELGVEDDEPVESIRHREQGDLLLHLLKRVWPDRDDICIAGDLGVFYLPKEPPVVPDAMVVFGVPRRDRDAFLVWKEKKGPDWVVELLSKSNPKKDRERNYRIYSEVLRVPEYVWFDPHDPEEWRAFRLAEPGFEEMSRDEEGRVWSEVLGMYLGVHDDWLRFYDRQGDLVPTGEELARIAQAEAQRERTAREAAEAELARLQEELARLRHP